MKYNTEDFKWNVIEEDEFKERITLVFGKLATALSKTLGPFGANTMIENLSDNHITKDGYQLVKRITTDDALNNNILRLLFGVSSQVAIRVGDGTTSATVSAYELFNTIQSSNELKSVRPKELLDTLTKVVGDICEIVSKNATQIDKSENATYEEIKRIATISTNNDLNIAEMIQRVYVETQNPAIEYKKSKGSETKLEIVKGYKIPAMTYIDNIFLNSDDGLCNLNNPFMLLFDHKIDLDTYKYIINPAQAMAMKEGRKLLIIAPYFDSMLLDRLRLEINKQHKAIGETLSVYVRCSLINNHTKDMYQDFAALCGATVINETLSSAIISQVTGIDNEEENEVEIPSIDEMAGGVAKISIGEHSTFASGFIKKDDSKIELLLNDAKSKFTVAEEQAREFNIVSDETFRLKQRISKLRCEMGVLSVGGGTELEKQSNYDLVEDAVKACDSAYFYGYNNGQNTAILKAINELETTATSFNECIILSMIKEAFKNVFGRVLLNKYKTLDNDELEETINTCLEENKCFDLLNETYTDRIINSCRTDIEILKATTSIIGLLVSSNQYVSMSIQ